MRRLLLAVIPMALFAPLAQASGDPLYPQQWNLAMVESDAAHTVTRGAGATVAVVDTGFTAGHPDLAGRLSGGFDFVDNDTDPADGEGHGTHVSGIVVANENNGIGVGSVAPEAKLLAVRVLGNDGSGSNADVQAGIDYAVKSGADVINLSLGPELPPILGGSDPAIDRALDAGVVVVVAAGNNGIPLCENPSGQGRLLCVGAVDKRRQRSSFSSFGLGLGLMGPGGSGLPTPGEDVLSTLKDGSYGEMAGTSQATPHVAGVAALLVSAGVKGQAAVKRILATASDAGAPGPDAEFGAGIVNARAAVAGLGAGAGSPNGTAPPGQNGGAGSAARVLIARTQRRALRRGLRVKCRAAGAGSCTVLARARGKIVARGSRPVVAGREVTVVAKLTAAARKALRKNGRLRVKVTVQAPGAGPVKKSVLLRP